MAKYKESIVWRRKTEKALEYNGKCWFIHQGEDIDRVLEKIFNGDGWRALSLEDRIEFAHDALEGRVFIGQGLNESVSKKDTWPDGTMYTSQMFSVRDECDTLLIHGDKKSYEWGAYRYRIYKTKPLPEDKITIIKELYLPKMEDNDCEQDVFQLFDFLLKIMEGNGREIIAEELDKPSNSNKVRFNIHLHTEGLLDPKIYNQKIEGSKKIIETALDWTAKATGKRITIPTCDFFEGLLNTRFVSNKNTLLEDTNKEWNMVDILNKAIENNHNSNIFTCISLASTKYIDDDSVVCISMDSSKIPMGKWENVPNAVAFTHSGRDSMNESYINYTLYIYGQLMTIFKGIGKDNFLNLMKNKLK